MTIYKPKSGNNKIDKKVLLSTVVIQDDVKPFAGKEKKDGVAPVVLVLQSSRRVRLILFLLLIFVFVSLCLAGAFLLYRTRIIANKPYMEICNIKYYDDSESPTSERLRGDFIEQVEIDQDDGVYEKLDVPPILESMRSTVVHDFERNLTAIVDRDNERCFVLPLNRTAVKPPKSFLDLLIKFKAGYYLPDAKVVRENYRVQFPAVVDLDSFGFFIQFDCQNYDTYILVHEDQPYAMAKRSACEMSGETFSLGDTGNDELVFIKLHCM